MKSYFYNKKHIFVLGFVALIIALSGVVYLLQAKSVNVWSTYDPATYGIPEFIAGYKILAIQTLDNTACMKSGEMLVTLQASEATLSDFLSNSNPKILLQALNKLHIKGQTIWEFQYIGPGNWDKQQFVYRNDDWNKTISQLGCITLWPPGVPPPGSEEFAQVVR